MHLVPTFLPTTKNKKNMVLPAPLRAALVAGSDEEKNLKFYFYYDEHISVELKNLSHEAVNVACTTFPHDYPSKVNIEFLAFPEEFPDFDKR